jgi:glycolate oxidase FAD binding subunit
LHRHLTGAGVRFDAMADWGGGLVWIAMLGDANGEGLAMVQHLRDFCRGTGGHATVVKAPESLRAQVPIFQPEPAALAALTKGLRAKFDPRGIFNPGIMG